MTEITICPVCGKKDCSELSIPNTGRIMFSDSSVGSGKLSKIICTSCGLARSRFALDPEEAEQYYRDDYNLNTNDGEEHYFYINGKPIARSEVIFDRYIKNSLNLTNCKTILEVGCGKGSLLKVISRNWPHVLVKGIEASIEACESGRKSGLDIHNGFLDEKTIEEIGMKFDAVIAIGVIEHVIDPLALLSRLSHLLKSGGHLLIACPDASCFAYDIFFEDHFFHFTPNHLIEMLGKVSIKCDRIVTNEAPLYKFLCAIGTKNKDVIPDEIKGSAPITIKTPSRCRETVAYYKKIFKTLDSKLNNCVPGSVAAYGGSEILALFFAYTRLGEQKLKVVFDDSPKNTEIFNVPVCHGDKITNWDPKQLL